MLIFYIFIPCKCNKGDTHLSMDGSDTLWQLLLVGPTPRDRLCGATLSSSTGPGCERLINVPGI